MPPRGLSPQALNRMHNNVARMLPDLCTIQQYISSSDGRGGFTEAWYPVGEFNCQISQSKEPILEIKGEKETFIVYFLITLPYNAPLGIDYRIVHKFLTYRVRTLVDDLAPAIYKQARIARIE